MSNTLVGDHFILVALYIINQDKILTECTISDFSGVVGKLALFKYIRDVFSLS